MTDSSPFSSGHQVLTMEKSYKINSPRIAGEIVDGEVIIVDLETGSYFSSQGSGAEIWGLIDMGCSVETIISAFVRRYPERKDSIQSEVPVFLRELERHELVVGAPASQASPPMSQPPARVDESGEFPPPVLNSFTDMQDLLLLDPIHEVDSKGWPYRQTDED